MVSVGLSVFTVIQGRVYAKTADEAVEKIRDKLGDGKLCLYKCLIQPRKDLIWFEYNIEV